MYVILTQDVPQVGQKNGLVNVARGYFMNFLHPRGLAKMASAEVIEHLKDSIAAQKAAAAEAAQKASGDAVSLKGAVLSFTRKASEKGTLFKAVTEKDVVKSLEKDHGVVVEPSAVTMNHVKEVGDHAIQVQFGDQGVEMKVTVIAAEEA